MRPESAKFLSDIRQAIAFHLEGLVEDRQPIPDPGTLVDYVHVSIPAVTR